MGRKKINYKYKREIIKDLGISITIFNKALIKNKILEYKLISAGISKGVRVKKYRYSAGDNYKGYLKKVRGSWQQGTFAFNVDTVVPIIEKFLNKK